MQSPVAIATLKRLTDGRLRRSEEQDFLAYGMLAALVALVALGAIWSTVANYF